MTRRTGRRATAGAGLLLTTLLTGCGGSPSQDPPEEPGASSEASPGAGPASDLGADELARALADPGQDLLAEQRRADVFEDTGTELAWRFPEGYEPLDDRQATLDADGGLWDLQVGAKPGVDRVGYAEDVASQASDDVRVDVSEVTMRDETFSLVSQETDDIAAHWLLWTPPQDEVAYAVILYGPPPLAEVAAERLEELAQLAGSLEYGGDPL